MRSFAPVANARKAPDTAVLCKSCQGTGHCQVCHPADRRRTLCGACFGAGLSTAPWDQRRNGTTITIWDSEIDDAREHYKDCTFHNPPPGQSTRTSRIVGTNWQEGGSICLISWANLNYRGT